MEELTEEEEVAKQIYDKMKGFRVKNSHRKKCAIETVDLIIGNLCWCDGCKECSFKTEHFYMEVIKEIQKL